jgi:hypothetical protein
MKAVNENNVKARSEIAIFSSQTRRFNTKAMDNYRKKDNNISDRRE